MAPRRRACADGCRPHAVGRRRPRTVVRRRALQSDADGSVQSDADGSAQSDADSLRVALYLQPFSSGIAARRIGLKYH
ncbi:hypothetical protein ANANG_G00221480 [Anguilla anguilla]|uniref:Uncharacterized protein n=1 Tax=Anguilla anguilla TaxID=7936 RepID=A0A9D3LXJ6_ANGAN|nr:hypothetical protein ANANG_G00221480 [Anguilla anguilla]